MTKGEFLDRFTELMEEAEDLSPQSFVIGAIVEWLDEDDYYLAHEISQRHREMLFGIAKNLGETNV